MKIYIIMCLGDLVGDTYYTDEKEVSRVVETANANMGGDFWYKELNLESSMKGVARLGKQEL